jgi:hypothetical protein
MVNTSSVAPAFKDAFVSAATTLWTGTDVLVSFGHPGQSQPDDIVGFLDVRTEQDPATFGTNRSREEVLEIDVLVSCYRGGGPDMEKVVSDRAYELLGQLESAVHYGAGTTVGATVRECFLLRTSSTGRTEPTELAAGRTIEITATFQAKARISN